MSGATTDAAALQALAGHIEGVDGQLAESADAPAGGAPGAPADGPPADPGTEVASMLLVGVAMLTPVMPFLPACYTPEACQSIGVAFNAVAEKRGWNLADIMTPELALCVAAAPPTIQAVILGRVYFAEKAARAGTPHEGAAPGDGQALQLVKGGADGGG